MLFQIAVGYKTVYEESVLPEAFHSATLDEGKMYLYPIRLN